MSLLLLFNQPSSGNPTVAVGATEAPDEASFSVSTWLAVNLTATEAPDTAAFNVSVLASNPTVSLGATEEPDIASFTLLGPDIPQTGGGAGDYFTSLLNFAERRRRVEEELRDDPSPEVVTEAAQLYADDLPQTVDLEAAQAQVAALIEQQTRLSAYLQALVYAEVARALEAKRQAEIEEDDAEAAIALQLIFTQTL